MPDRIKTKQSRAREGVFISYARSDGKDFAAQLRTRLDSEGFSLWQDVIAMEGGRDWWLQITEALDHVEFMALVITPNALKSDTVRKEWRYARQQDVCVYPIKGWPGRDFPAMPRWMSEKHFYDLDDPLQVEKFLNDLNTRCDEPRVPFMAEPLPPDFIPRPAEFNQLLSRLLDRESGDSVAITAALRGAGGYGKTTLAKALCHDEEVQNAFDGGILWVEVQHYPFASIVLEADRLAFVALERELGSGFAYLGRTAEAQRQTRKAQHCYERKTSDLDLFPAHFLPFMIGG